MNLQSHCVADLLFKGSLLFALILLIALSWNAPLSGDEYVHVQQAEKNIDYLKSWGAKREALNTPISRLKHYGQSFDTITTYLAQVFNVENLYRFRHVSNAVMAWLTILFTALITIKITRETYAGIITILLFLASMRFMGHAMNNLKDIPFAFAFIFSIYFIIRFCEKLPRISLPDLCFVAAGLAFGISIRIGGLLIFAYYLLFTSLYVYYLAVNGQVKISKLPSLCFRLTILSVGVLILGYFTALLVWPWGLEDPIANPIRSLELIHNYPTTVRQIFEGKLYWSDNFPWYYLIKYMIITVPLIVWIGIMLFLWMVWKWNNRSGIVMTIFLLIALGFPLFYAPVSGANLYGGWRQMLFTYPPLIALSAIGIWRVIQQLEFNKRWSKMVIIGLSLGLIYPFYFLATSYPYQYVFFNFLTGGTNGAYGNYELDYYFTSYKKAYQFIDNTVTDKGRIVAANFIIPEYYDGKIYHPKLIDYYDRSSVDWDYAVICNTFLDPFQLKNGFWPPDHVVYTEFIHNVPILVVLKRTDKTGLEGKKLMDIGKFEEAIEKLNQARKSDPDNESILINLARAHKEIGNYSESEMVLSKLDHIYPKNEWATDMRGEIALKTGDIQEALELFEKNISYNYKFYHSYLNKSLAYLELGQPEEAILTIKSCLRINPFYEPGYQLYGHLLIDKGEVELGQKMLEFKVGEDSKYKRK